MASEIREPNARGWMFSFVHGDHLYVYHTRAGRQLCHAEDGLPYYRSSQNVLPLQRFDFSSAQWSGVRPASVDSEPEESDMWSEFAHDHCFGLICCAVLGDCAYTYGGYWKYGYAVH